MVGVVSAFKLAGGSVSQEPARAKIPHYTPAARPALKKPLAKAPSLALKKPPMAISAAPKGKAPKAPAADTSEEAWTSF
jgi:hypothetical protein